MINKGMDNNRGILKGLVSKAINRINEIKDGSKPSLSPDSNAKYHAELTVDLDYNQSTYDC